MDSRSVNDTDIIKVSRLGETSSADVIWLYVPFAMASLLNLQYAFWACCTDARAWRHHRNAAFARPFFMLLANVWVTNLIHGLLVVTANIFVGPNSLRPTPIPVMHSENDDSMTGLRSNLGEWHFVFRIGVPLTVATRAWSNLVAIVIAMQAEATLAFASGHADCERLGNSFRWRLLAIIFGLWAVDCFLVFTPFLASYVHEVFLLTILYAWTVYITFLAFIWIILLSCLVHRRARKLHEANPKSCPSSILTNVKKKIAILMALSVVICVTLLPWPICEVMYLNRDLYDIVMPYIWPFISGLNKRVLYSYICILPYVYFVAESILVVMFRETRWRFCLGQRGTIGAEQTATNTDFMTQQKSRMESDLFATRQRKLQETMFSEHLEQLRVHLYSGSAYSTLSRETSV